MECRIEAGVPLASSLSISGRGGSEDPQPRTTEGGSARPAPTSMTAPGKEMAMPEKRTLKKARAAKRAGKSPTTQAGEFVHEEIKHVREGKHGARSAKQAIAIGLSKARRAGVDLPPPKEGTVSKKTRRSAASAYRKGQEDPNHKPSRKRSHAREHALEKEGTQAASETALS